MHGQDLILTPLCNVSFQFTYKNVNHSRDSHLALSSSWSRAARALPGTGDTPAPLLVSEVVRAAGHRALLVLAVAHTFLADVLVEAVAITLLTERMTGPTDGLPCQSGQLPALLLGSDPLVEISLRTVLRLVKTLHHLQFCVDDGLVAAVAAEGANVVCRALTASDTVAVTVLTLPVRVVVLRPGTLGHTERSVLHIATFLALVGSGSVTCPVTLCVTLHTLTVVQALVETLQRVAALNTLGLDHEVLAGEAERAARPPAALAVTLIVTHLTRSVTRLGRLVVLE